MKRFPLWFLFAVALALCTSVAAFSATIRSYPPSAFASIYLGSNGHGLTNSGYACSESGTWTQRASASSSSGTFTVQGAQPGDACMTFPAAALTTNQALTWTCSVLSSNTVRLRVTNASGGTITPTAGSRCAATFTPL